MNAEVAPEPRPLGPGWEWTEASFPLIQVGKVVLNVHPLLLIWMLGELLASIVHAGGGATVGGAELSPQAASAMVSAWILVLMGREWCRVAWARRLGSDATSSTLWMLGGVESVGRPWLPNPRLAEAGGVLAGMFVWPFLAFAVWRTSGVAALIFDPLRPGLAVPASAPFVHQLAFWAYAINAGLVIVNLLLRAFPLDAGRVLEARLLPFHGRRAFDRTLPVAIGFAGGLMVLSAPLGLFRLFVMAGVVLLWQVARWQAYRPLRVAMVVDRSSGHGEVRQDGFAQGLSDAMARDAVAEQEPHARSGLAVPPTKGTPGAGGETKSRSKTRPMDDAPLSVDQVLAKVAQSGLGSLTPDERATLDRESRRLREQ